MREIKFKAWDSVLNQFLPNIQNHIGNDGWGFGHLIKNERYKVCQFTGLKDKNEKEIYEGDIVSMQHGLYNYTVHFENGSFVCYHLEAKDLVNGGKLKWGLLSRSFDLGEDYQLEVIGNIHQK